MQKVCFVRRRNRTSNNYRNVQKTLSLHFAFRRNYSWTDTQFRYITTTHDLDAHHYAMIGDNRINIISLMGIGAIVILTFTIIVGLIVIFMILKYIYIHIMITIIKTHLGHRYSGFKCSRVSCCCSSSGFQNHVQMRNRSDYNRVKSFTIFIVIAFMKL